MATAPPTWRNVLKTALAVPARSGRNAVEDHTGDGRHGDSPARTDEDQQDRFEHGDPRGACTWTWPTDCTEWDVRQLVAHIAGMTKLFSTGAKDLKRRVCGSIAVQPQDLTWTPTDTEEVTITAITG